MSPFFLGFFYFYITINQAESLSNLIPIPKWETFTESTLLDREYIVSLNCTQCNITPLNYCRCFESYGRHLLCCPDDQCCYCEDCNLYLHGRQQELLIITQISVTVLCAFGILGLIIIYWKLCRRTRQDIRRPRCIVFRDEYNTMAQCSTIEGSRERPPPYSAVACNTSVDMSTDNAPPLYTSPYNRISMQEAPPSYPGTPKPQERSDQLPIVSVIQHM